VGPGGGPETGARDKSPLLRNAQRRLGSEPHTSTSEKPFYLPTKIEQKINQRAKKRFPLGILGGKDMDSNLLYTIKGFRSTGSGSRGGNVKRALHILRPKDPMGNKRKGTLRKKGTGNFLFKSIGKRPGNGERTCGKKDDPRGSPCGAHYKKTQRGWT